MDKTIHKGSTRGCVTAPPSKSYAQRAIAAALLCRGETVLSNMVYCNDTRAVMQVACDLGAEIDLSDNVCTVRGGLQPRKRELNIGESGLATRLFTPVTALCPDEIVLTGEGTVMNRPISMMEVPLRELGAEISSNGGYLPIRVKGPVRGGYVAVDGSLSSQFITGLLMALPLAGQDTTLNVADLKSKPYIDMTIGLLDAFGIEIKHNDYKQFFIEGGQRYVPTRYNIEGDWSGASCLLVAGATSGQVTVRNLNPLSLQADTAIIDALAHAGAEITTTRDSVTVRRNGLRAFEFDATHCPDLFPALAALAANCRGTSVIRGTCRLVHKESNRARTLADVFTRMGIETDIETENVMRITGGQIRSTTVDSHNDHRIAMAAAVAALNSENDIVVRHAEAVNKSYPEFWDDFRSLVAENH